MAFGVVDRPSLDLTGSAVQQSLCVVIIMMNHASTQLNQELNVQEKCIAKQFIFLDHQW